MGYVKKKNLARKENYGAKRNTEDVKYITIHYTGNDGDHDEGNAAYFHNTITKTSAHYFVDDDSVTQSVPDNYIAYSVGGTKYADCDKTGGGKLYKKAKNSNTINIEMCDTSKDGHIMASEKTINNTVELVRELMVKYNIPIENVIRHFDVTGKHCPAYFMDDKAWNDFLKKLTINEEITDNVTEVKSKFPYLVKVTCLSLNVRKGPGTNYPVVKSVKRDEVYTIVDEKDGFGKLKSGAGWICLKFVKEK